MKERKTDFYMLCMYEIILNGKTHYCVGNDELANFIKDYDVYSRNQWVKHDGKLKYWRFCLKKNDEIVGDVYRVKLVKVKI